MTEQWDGRPQNPEQDGWHWLQWVGLFPADTLGHTNPVARYWEKDGWWDGSMHRHARYWQQGWRYVAPVLTPAEVAAREAAAWERGKTETLAAVATPSDADWQNDDAVRVLSDACKRVEVLNLPADISGALEARVAAARRDAIEACESLTRQYGAEVAERKLEDKHAQGRDYDHNSYGAGECDGAVEASEEIAAAIRALLEGGR